MVIPGAAIFYAASHVPAGVLSITVGIVPILTFAASAFFGLERYAVGRIAGVFLGALAVVLLVGPQGSLPDPAQLPWVFIGLVSAVSYATLNIVLALRAPPGANPLMLTCGMFVVASVLMVPVVYVTGAFVPFAWPWTTLEWSLLGLGVVNAIAYPLYFWLVDHAGPVFGSLAANMVTLFGVIWGIVIFFEQNSIWVWLSFATLMVALLLVTPRGRTTPATNIRLDVTR
jgi:drug/metabolite transporter (DMT)-like permease